MDQIVTAVTDRRVPIFLVLIVLGVAWKGWIWANDTFVTEDQMSGLETLLRTHIKEYRINEAIDRVEKLDSQLAHLTLHETVSGETADTKALRRELVDRRNHALEYRNCVLHDRPNCDLLER